MFAPFLRYGEEMLALLLSLFKSWCSSDSSVGLESTRPNWLRTVVFDINEVGMPVGILVLSIVRLLSMVDDACPSKFLRI